MSPYPSAAVSDGLLSLGITTSYFLTSHPTFPSYAYSTVSAVTATKSKRLTSISIYQNDNIYFLKCMNLYRRNESAKSRETECRELLSRQQNAAGNHNTSIPYVTVKSTKKLRLN
jgi:hypothetical protein